MPRTSRKKLLKIPFQPFDADKENSRKYGSTLLKGKGVSGLESATPSFCDPNKPKQSPSLVQKVLGSGSRRTEIVGGIPRKSTMNTLSGRLHLKSRNVSVNKLRTRDTSFLDKRVDSPRMEAEGLIQKENAAPQFLSILVGKGRLVRHKTAPSTVRQKVWGDSEETKRLPYAKKLQLFQALLKEPLPFLDLHVRFGISRQTIKGLVKKGTLAEIWGPKDIGVRFKLTKKGKIYLKEAEAAEWELRIREKDFIRLKHKTTL